MNCRWDNRPDHTDIHAPVDRVVIVPCNEHNQTMSMHLQLLNSNWENVRQKIMRLSPPSLQTVRVGVQFNAPPDTICHFGGGHIANHLTDINSTGKYTNYIHQKAKKNTKYSSWFSRLLRHSSARKRGGFLQRSRATLAIRTPLHLTTPHTHHSSQVVSSM